MGRCVAATENHAANAGLLDKLQQKAAECGAKFLIVGCPGGRTQRSVENSIATGSQRMRGQSNCSLSGLNVTAGQSCRVEFDRSLTLALGPKNLLSGNRGAASTDN